MIFVRSWIYLVYTIFIIMLTGLILLSASSRINNAYSNKLSPIHFVRTIYHQFIFREHHLHAASNIVVNEKPLNSYSQLCSSKESLSFNMQGIADPLVKTAKWKSFTGHEFYFPCAVTKFADMGIKLTNSIQTKSDLIEWKAECSTKTLINKNDNLLREALRNNTILTWKGIFSSSGYGSNYPVIRTHYLIPMSPLKFTKLIMDSSRVYLYNKYSLGRKDLIVFQSGDHASSNLQSRDLVKGEAKIVVNKTQFPWKRNKTLEAVTFMYARPLDNRDNVPKGILSRGKSIEDHGYIVVSRAVDGGKLIGKSNPKSQVISEILLGINLIRSVAGDPNKAEVTTISQVKSPLIPPVIAGKMGIKCALDFIYSIRAIQV